MDLPIAQVVLFTSLFAVVMILVHGYIGWRLVAPGRLSRRVRRRIWWLLGASVALQTVVLLVQIVPLPQELVDRIASAGYFLLGAVILTW